MRKPASSAVLGDQAGAEEMVEEQPAEDFRDRATPPVVGHGDDRVKVRGSRRAHGQAAVFHELPPPRETASVLRSRRAPECGRLF